MPAFGWHPRKEESTKPHRLGCTVVLLLLMSIVVPLASYAASFTGLGLGPSGTGSFAASVSADGSMVVGTTAQLEAFRWTATDGMVGLGFLPGVPNGGAQISDGYAASADGSVVVGDSSSASGIQAFRWNAAGGMVGLGFLPGFSLSSAHGVSGDGSVVVGGGNNGDAAFTNEAFRWTSSGGMMGLGFLPGIPTNGAQTYSDALGVSADGSVVVGFGSSASGEQAFRWTSGSGMLGLGYLGGNPSFLFSQAAAASRDGSVVVGGSTYSTSAPSSHQAFRWTSGGGVVGLGFIPGGSNSFADAVTPDGSIVVGGGDAAFIWDSTHGMRSLQQVLTTDYGLDLTGWTLTYADGVSTDGSTIVGTGRDPKGFSEAWIATIPEPGTGSLVLTGFVGIAARRRRARSDSLGKRASA